ncbi:MAG: hypothetical protein KGL39_17750 [Patescibacteria group bacterium]|nr:hypothetical protein [Patescibacteria group bacterium]
MKEKFDQSQLTSDQIHLGSKAHEDFCEGMNPPSWVEDEGAWAKAKEAALKSYDLDDDAYWPVVVHIYENMGGTVGGGDAAANDAGFRIALNNESASIDADGWALIAPFGNWPKTRVYRENGQLKEQKFIQVLDNESADALLAKENGIFRRLKRALVGIPVFKGHGDLNDVDPKAVANETQKIKLGVVDQVRKSARGIEAHFALDNDGAQAVAAGYKFPSSFWYVVPNGQQGDATLVKPFKLISVALTQFPNISGVQSLANANPTQPAASKEEKTRKDQMKSLLIGWLAAKGIVLANDATDQQVLEAVQRQATEQIASVTALGNEKTTLGGKITVLENEKATEKKRADEAATALANEQTARKTERKGRAEATVDLAIHRGILTIAERESNVTALENSADFAKDAGELLKKAPTHKTTTNNRAEAGRQAAALSNEAAQTQQEYNTAFQAELTKNNQDPVKAHRAIMSKPEYSALAQKLMPKQS